jgi:hypothetical protein
VKDKRAFAMTALLLSVAPGMPAEINVMSGGAPKEALAIHPPIREADRASCEDDVCGYRRVAAKTHAR